MPAAHMIIGGIAVIARGVVRLTDDVGATVWAPDVELEELVVALADEDIVGRIPDAVDFARANQVLLLRHEPSGTPMEVSLAWLPFEEQALGRAERLDFRGVRAPVAIAEDLIVQEAVAWRDRDRDDCEKLLRLHGDALDLDRVRALVAAFAEALDATERVTAFEALIGTALVR